MKTPKNLPLNIRQMSYASETVSLALPVDKAFQYLVDLPRKRHGYLDGEWEVWWTSPAPTAVGRNFMARAVGKSEVVEYQGTITGFEPNRRVAYELKGGRLSLHWSFTLSPKEDGGTLLECECRAARPIPFVVLHPVLQRGLRRSAHKIVGNLKRWLETGTVSQAA
ncbi:MAG: SRPBCC family protein [Chloroflexi bacterium]|nr:SRPBCC family protein [Chloroflexota bacterium]